MKKLADISIFENLESSNKPVFNASKHHRVRNTVWPYRKLYSRSKDPGHQLNMAQAQRAVNVLAALAQSMGVNVMDLIRMLGGVTAKGIGGVATGLGKGLEKFGEVYSKGGARIMASDPLGDAKWRAKKRLQSEIDKGRTHVDRAKQIYKFR